MKARRHLLIRLSRHRRGIAAVEFALIAPILVVCLLAVYDLGRALQQQIRLNQAVEAGGLYAITWFDRTSEIVSVVSAAAGNMGNVSIYGPVAYCQCWNSVTSATNAQGCTFSTASVCGGTSVFRRFVSIGAARSVTPIFFTTLTTTSVKNVVLTQTKTN